MKNLLWTVLALALLACGRSAFPVDAKDAPASQPGETDGGEPPFELPACPDCAVRCTTHPRPGEPDEVLRIFIRRSDAAGALIGRVERGPLHLETRAGPAAGAPVVIAEGEGTGELQYGQFTGDPAMLTSARAAFDGAELQVDLTFSYIELTGVLSLAGEERPAVCWDPAALARKVTYDPAAGDCSGEGLGTPFTVAFVRETKDGECAIPMHSDLHEGSPSGAVLRGWNLAGAKLGLGLHSADVS